MLTGGVLIIVGVAASCRGIRAVLVPRERAIIGAGMIPRGEVGLIFARIGLSSQVFDAGLFGATAMMVMVTTLLAPPGLKYLLRDADASPDPLGHDEEVEDLVAGV